MNWEIPDVQAGFRKGRGTRDQIANICWIIEKATEFQKIIYLCFIDYVKLLTVWITANYGKFLKRWEYQMETLYLPPEKPVCRSRNNRTGHGTMDWFKIGKVVHQGCILSAWVFNFSAEYISVKCQAGWITVASRLPGEISTTSDIQMILP